MSDFYGSLSSVIHALYDYQRFDDNQKIRTIIMGESNSHEKLKLLKHKNSLRSKIKKLFNRLIKPNHHEMINAVGFKITVDQAFKNVPDFWKNFLRTSPNKIIFLKRNNLLERFLSYKTVAKSGIWHSNKPIEKNVPIRIDFSEFCRFVDQSLSLERLIQEERDKNGLEWLEVSYEELVMSKADLLKKVFSFLDVPYTDKLDGKIVKLSQGTTAMRITNFAELQELAANTIYEPYIK